MLKTSSRWLLILAGAFLLPGCDQRPIDMGPESTGMHWEPVLEFGVEEGRQADVQVWAGSDSDVWAWGRWTDPPLQRFDGSAWAEVSFPGDSNRRVVGIWGSGPADVYVANGTLWHYNGSTWSDTGVPAEYVNGSTSSNVFTGTSEHLVHFDGVAWDTLLSMPDTNFVRDVSAYGVGAAFVAARDSVMRWNGVGWSAWKLPGFAWYVMAFSENSCVAAGVTLPFYSDQLWEFNGADWTLLTSPPGELYDVDLWGASPSSLWITGYGGRLSHFDGSAWATVQTPTHEPLYSVWGTSPDDVYAATANGVVVRAAPASASTIRAGFPTRSFSIWAESPSDFMVGGESGTLYRFESGNWSNTILDGEQYPVTAISGSSTDLYAGTGRGRIYHFDGGAWSLFADSLIDYFDIDELSATSDGSVYAAGHGLAWFDGSSWQTASEGRRYVSVWGFSRSVAYAISYDVVRRWDGSNWTTSLGPVRGAYYTDVWGSSENDVYVCGHEGIEHFDGSVWRRALPGQFDMIVGTGPDDVLAVGPYGMAHFDGTLWRRDDEPSCRCEPTDIIAAVSGDVLRLSRVTNGSLVSQRMP